MIRQFFLPLIVNKITQRSALLISLVLLSHIGLASDINIVARTSKPPYVIEFNSTGFEVDLVRQVMNLAGMSPNFHFHQFGISPQLLDADGVDAVMTAKAHIFSDIATLSDNYIVYQNVAISMKKNKLAVSRIEDLGNYSIASFQMAHKVLGEQFAQAAQKSPLYVQVLDQYSQPEMLTMGRIDTLVIDINIFNFLLAELGWMHRYHEFEIHQVFPPSHYKMAFKDAKKAALFNEALHKFKQSPQYQQLIDKYAMSAQQLNAKAN